MAKDPAFLFYPADFLVGTSFMTLEEIGAYIKLLCFLADKGTLSQEQILKKIPSPIWEAIWHKFDKDEDGRFFNKRLRLEVEKRKNYTKSRHMNLHMDSHMEAKPKPHMENENVNRDVDEKRDVKSLYGEYKHVRLTDKELSSLKDRLGDKVDFWIKTLDEGIELKGYKYKNHYLAILKWVNRENKQGGMADVIKKLDSRKTTEV